MSDFTFKVLLEGDLYSLAHQHFKCYDMIKGRCSFTSWGKKRDKEKYLPQYDETLNLLNEMIEKTYPEFVDRYECILRRTIRNQTFYFLEVVKEYFN